MAFMRFKVYYKTISGFANELSVLQGRKLGSDVRKVGSRLRLFRIPL